MTVSESTPPDTPLAACADERFVAPWRNATLRSRKGFIAAVVLVLAAHLAILAAFLYRDSKDVPAPVPEETPVEVVMEPPEPPKPPPPPPPQQKPPPPAEEDDRPAFSAPRVAKEKLDDPGKAAATEGPKAETPPRDGKPAPDKAEPPPPAPEKPADVAKKSQLEDDQRQAEALDKAAPEPDKTQDEAQNKPLPKPAQPSTGETEPTMAGRADNYVPNFASADVLDAPAGEESNRYIARIFGMILGKKKYAGTSSERRNEKGAVAITFFVDFDGRLRHMEVSRSSGLASLDALAMNAVRNAGPFPPPPGSGGQAYIANITFP